MKFASTISIAAAVALLASAPGSAQTSAPAVYIHAGALLDRPGQAPRGASTIIVRDGRDRSRSATAWSRRKRGARLVDLSKQFVLPGLIDMHVHIFNDDDKMRARLEQNNRDIEDNLLIGVGQRAPHARSGFHDACAISAPTSAASRRCATRIAPAASPGRRSSPPAAASRSLAVTAIGRTTPIATSPRWCGRTPTNICNGADDCRRAVREQISQGADVIKFAATGGVNSNIAGGLNQQMFADEMKAIVDTAHMFGRKVAAHAHGQNGIKAALEAGVDSIEHGTYTDAQTNALFKKTRRLARADDDRAARGAGAGAGGRALEEHAGEGRGSRRGARQEHRRGDQGRRQDRVRHRHGRVGSRQERTGVRAAREGRHDARGRDPGGDARCGDAARPCRPHRHASSPARTRTSSPSRRARSTTSPSWSACAS